MASFRCSRCRLPISLNPELSPPSKTTQDLLRNASTTPRPAPGRKAYPPEREVYLHNALADSTATVMDMSTNKSRSIDHRKPFPPANTTESFVFLSETPEDHAQQYGPRDSISENLDQQRILFDILSKNSEVDHPLCAECTDHLIAGMNKKMTELERDRKAYISYLQKVKDEIPSEEDHRQAAAELEDLKGQEREAVETLKAVEQERAEVLAELAQLERDSVALDKEERDFWQTRNAFAAEIAQFEQERDSIDLRFEHDARQLERLQRTNVYNDTFQIGHDGNFGTINGLRLGRLSNHPVSWDEINAAWGLTLLLLQTMAEKLQFTFSGYRLHPMGSTSKIDKIESGPGEVARVITLELFGTTEVNPLKLFQRNSFDKAVVAFLECLRQLGDFAETKDTVVMPYKIHKDKISDVCVRMAFNQDEGWTRALKFCLTNCKWILAVVAKTSKV